METIKKRTLNKPINVRTLISNFDKEKPSIALYVIAEGVVYNFMFKKHKDDDYASLDDAGKKKYDDDYTTNKNAFEKHLVYEFVKLYYSDASVKNKLKGESRKTIEDIEKIMTSIAEKYDVAKYNIGGELSENDLKQKLINILDTLEATDLMDFIYHIGNVESDYVDDIFEDYESWVNGLPKDELDMILWRMKMPYFYVHNLNEKTVTPVPSKFATYSDFYEKKYKNGGSVDVSVFNQKTDLLGDDKQRHQMLFDEFKKKESRGRFSKEDVNKEEVINIIKVWYKDSVQHAIDKGWYQEDIEKGRMTASDAKKIIESAGLEVPNDIFANGGGIGCGCNHSMENGGFIDSSRRFTQEDFTKLTEGGFMSYNQIGNIWAISEGSGKNFIGKWDSERDLLFIMGKADSSHPLVKWLQENGYVTEEESTKLGIGGVLLGATAVAGLIYGANKLKKPTANSNTEDSHKKWSEEYKKLYENAVNDWKNYPTKIAFWDDVKGANKSGWTTGLMPKEFRHYEKFENGEWIRISKNEYDDFFMLGYNPLKGKISEGKRHRVYHKPSKPLTLEQHENQEYKDGGGINEAKIISKEEYELYYDSQKTYFQNGYYKYTFDDGRKDVVKIQGDVIIFMEDKRDYSYNSGILTMPEYKEGQYPEWIVTYEMYGFFKKRYLDRRNYFKNKIGELLLSVKDAEKDIKNFNPYKVEGEYPNGYYEFKYKDLESGEEKVSVLKIYEGYIVYPNAEYESARNKGVFGKINKQQDDFIGRLIFEIPESEMKLYRPQGFDGIKSLFVPKNKSKDDDNYTGSAEDIMWDRIGQVDIFSSGGGVGSKPVINKEKEQIKFSTKKATKEAVKLLVENGINKRYIEVSGKYEDTLKFINYFTFKQAIGILESKSDDSKFGGGGTKEEDWIKEDGVWICPTHYTTTSLLKGSDQPFSGIHGTQYSTTQPDGMEMGFDADWGDLVAYKGRLISVHDLPNTVKIIPFKEKSSKVFDNGGGIEGGTMDLSTKEKSEMYNWIDKALVDENLGSKQDLYEWFSSKFNKTLEQSQDIIDNGWAISRGATKKYNDGSEVDEHVYKLGDKYRSDFDYDGMLKMGLESNVSYGYDKLKELHNSFEDVNYATASKPLWDALQYLKEGKTELAEDKITEFHKLVQDEIDTEYKNGGFISADWGNDGSTPSNNKDYNALYAMFPDNHKGAKAIWNQLSEKQKEGFLYDLEVTDSASEHIKESWLEFINAKSEKDWLKNATNWDEMKEGGEVNDMGGYDYSESENEIAKKVDLITLPKAVEGTNCSNCMYVKILDAQKGLGFCTHKDIQLPVTARMCCALWDNKDASRSWEDKMATGGDVSSETKKIFERATFVRPILKKIEILLMRDFDACVNLDYSDKSDYEEIEKARKAYNEIKKYFKSSSNLFNMSFVDSVYGSEKVTSERLTKLEVELRHLRKLISDFYKVQGVIKKDNNTEIRNVLDIIDDRIDYAIEARRSLKHSKKLKRFDAGGGVGKIVTSAEASIKDVLTLPKYKRLTQEEGEYLYNAFKDYENLQNEDEDYVAPIKFAYDGHNFKEVEKVDKELEEFLEMIDHKGYIYYDRWDSEMNAYPITIDFVNSVRGRMQTRKNVSEGVDLFPSLSQIPEANPNFDEIQSNKSALATLLRIYTKTTGEKRQELWEKIQQTKQNIKDMELVEFKTGGDITHSKADMLKKLYSFNKHKGASEAIATKYKNLNTAFKVKTGRSFDEVLLGGKADGMDEQDLARKHGVNVSVIDRQLKKGIKVESEHIDNNIIAREIALDHIYEIVDYYDQLEIMEKQAGIKHTVNANDDLSDSQIKSISNYLSSKGLNNDDFEVHKNGTILIHKELDAGVLKQIKIYLKNTMI